MQCVSCHHVHTDIYYTRDGIDALYANPVDDGQRVGDDAEMARLTSSRMIERVVRLGPGAQTWLDVGIGNGALVLTAAEFGFVAHGIDPRPSNIAMLRRFGVDGTVSRWEEFSGSGPFDVVSMCDVIEHMAFPVEAIAKAARLMPVGGLMLITTPNLDAPFWKMMSAVGGNPYWQEIEHHHVFGRISLGAVLSRCGFAVVDYAVSERFKCGMEMIARKL